MQNKKQNFLEISSLFWHRYSVLGYFAYSAVCGFFKYAFLFLLFFALRLLIQEGLTLKQ